MEIIFFERLDSTQKFLLKKMQNNLCVVALKQTDGIGSRGNTWEMVESGLYFSFCIKKEALPNDLKIQSVSIFFGFIFKEVLRENGFDVWLKWPNDIYLQNQKIGGVVSHLKKEFLICGIGVNFFSKKFACLGSELDKRAILEVFFEKMRNTQEWKQIFRKYKLEFYKNSNFLFHYRGALVSFRNVLLLEDGSISFHGKKIYSLR